MVVLKGACRNYDALWYCLARCRDVGSDYNIFFFLFFCSKQQLLCVKNRQHAKRVCESLHAW